jgi:hypothetical protein
LDISSLTDDQLEALEEALRLTVYKQIDGEAVETEEN